MMATPRLRLHDDDTFGALYIAPPTPLQFPTQSVGFITPTQPPTCINTSLAFSNSPGNSVLSSALDSHSTDLRLRDCASVVLAPALPAALQASRCASLDSYALNLSFFGGSLSHNLEQTERKMNDKDAVGVALGSIESREDSFYASLLIAQKLQQQRELMSARQSPLTTGRGLPAQVDNNASLHFPSFQTCWTQQPPLTDADKTPRPSSQSINLENSNPAAVDNAATPHTLQSLLTWRQELLEARWKEQQQQQDKISTACWSPTRGSHLFPQRAACTAADTMTSSSPELEALQRSARIKSLSFPSFFHDGNGLTDAADRRTPSREAFTRDSASHTSSDQYAATRDHVHEVRDEDRTAGVDGWAEAMAVYEADMGQAITRRFAVLVVMAVLLLWLCNFPAVPWRVWGITL